MKASSLNIGTLKMDYIVGVRIVKIVDYNKELKKFAQCVEKLFIRSIKSI